MGASLTLPDESELKVAEKPGHDLAVRANIALVFVKPASCTEQCCAFVKSALTGTKGLQVLGECPILGPAIEEQGLIDKHYAEIAKAAMENDPADMGVGDDQKAKFKDTFGKSWDDAVAAHEVLNSRDAAVKLGAEDAPLSAKDLFNMWKASPIKLKMAPGCYVAKIKGAMPNPDAEEDDVDDDEEGAAVEEDMWVVDGFYPAMREKYVKEDAMVQMYVVGFDPLVLDWASFRANVIGATDPASADENSIRAKILKSWESLGLDEQPDMTNNGVHASAGPLEGLKERMTWLGFPLELDPTGRFLCELAVWDESKHSVLNMLLDNPTLNVVGASGKAFDITEDKNTSDLYVLANNLAFSSELEGI